MNRFSLSKEEVKTLEDIELTGYQDHAGNAWLISFYFAGMRLSDLMHLKWTDFKDAWLYYSMTKDLKAGSLRVPEKALILIEKYKADEQKNDFIFPELIALDELKPYYIQRKISYTAKRLDKTLKRIARDNGIKKNILMHLTRHTFAQLAGDKIQVQLLEKLYRHTKIETTMGYQSHCSNEHTDDALDTVLKF